MEAKKKKLVAAKKSFNPEKPLEQRIRERAYFAWQKAGSPQGRDIEFWASAERDLLKNA